jgi:hypothetical protein
MYLPGFPQYVTRAFRLVLAVLLVVLTSDQAVAAPVSGELGQPTPAFFDAIPNPDLREIHPTTDPVASGDWWNAAQTDIRRSEYQVTWQDHTTLSDIPAAYHAPNRAHNLRTYFTQAGPVIVPRTLPEGTQEEWHWGLRLVGWGRAEAIRPAPPASQLASQANRIEYRRGDLIEWYVNDERGLEQGFTLASPATGEPENSPLVLQFALSGDLTPRLNQEGTAVEFISAGGARVLRYGDLHAYDSEGKTLAAHLQLAGCGPDPLSICALQIVVDTAAAIYPITIDPLTTSPMWTAGGYQANSNFGFSVGTAGDVNGDGYADVVVGAPNFDDGVTDSGRAFVYHGSATGLNASYSWTAVSGQAGAQYGYSVGTAGDVNGDGYADVIVGSPYYDYGYLDAGVAFLYFGAWGGLGSLQMLIPPAPEANARFGFSVSTAGDTNRDGWADVVIGIPFADYGALDSGSVALYMGNGGGLSYSKPLFPSAPHTYGYFGYSVSTAGDVNGDAYADVIVGAPQYDNGQADEGFAFAFYGNPGGLNSTPSWYAESNQSSAGFGRSVAAAGDVNGDGFGDIIVGAFQYNNGEPGEGRVFVWHGSLAGLGANGQPGNAAWSAESHQANAQFGFSVGWAGDVNGDGYADVIIGAPYYDSGGWLDWGFAFVYPGSASGLATTPHWTILGPMPGARLGFSVGTAGDVNGDGYADVIVGTPYDNYGAAAAGRATVYHGSASGLSATANWTTESDQGEGWMGASVSAAGDVNGDGYADVIVSAHGYDNGEVDEGRVFVFHGSASGLSTTPNWTAESHQAEAYFGLSVGAAGDVNGDGYADVIVGAFYYTRSERHEGAAFIWFGSAAGLGANGDPTNADWIVYGEQASAVLGSSVGTAGDVNGDGYSDVVVGAPGYTNGETGEGRAFVYYGSATGPSTTADWTAESNQANAGFSRAMATAGDVNGDGYDDLIIGAHAYDTGLVDAGRVYVFYGSAHGLPGTPGWMADGDQASAYLGWSVGTAGDVNGDGYADIIMGAVLYDNGSLIDAGKAVLYHGSASGPGATPAWTVTGDANGATLGIVAAAGDVNGDGYADVIVGANGYDNPEIDEGRAYVYHGSASGLSTTANWQYESNQANGLFGASVSTAGDVNGDGYDDVIVGASGYDNGQSNEGRVYAFYGGGGAGLSLNPRQRRADDSAPAAPGGQVISPNLARLLVRGRAPFGRGDIMPEWETKPLGTPFDGTSQTGAWVDSGTGGILLNQAANLKLDTRYHWRVRLLGRPSNAQSARLITYRSRWIYGDTFFAALSGVQNIAGTGITWLLNQVSYVDVTTQGNLTGLTLRSYPNTAHPNENARGGGAAMLDRYYSLVPNVNDGSFSLRLCLAYQDAQIPGGVPETDLKLCRWTGSVWSCPERSAASDTINNIACADNVTSLSDWTIGSAGPTAIVLSHLAAGSNAVAGPVWVIGPAVLLMAAMALAWRHRRQA